MKSFYTVKCDLFIPLRCYFSRYFPITYMCLFHHGTLRICVPSWTITCMCFLHHGTLHIYFCSIMDHYIYMFVPSWNIMYLYLFCQGTLRICVCSIMAHYTVMKNLKWVFVNCDKNKCCISTAAEFFKKWDGSMTTLGLC